MITCSRLTALPVLLCAAAAPVFGQELKLTCGGDLNANCTRVVELPDSVQRARLVVKVTLASTGAAVPKAIVRFMTTAGSVEPDSTIADASGEARALWIRHKGSDQVAVAASAQLGENGSGTAFIRLIPDVAPDPRGIALIPVQGFQQSFYEKSQLPKEVRVKLVAAGGAMDRKSCEANRVVFKIRGAPQSVSPDTAKAWFEGECYADTFWTMGEGIGERRLDVTLVPSKSYTGSNELEAFAWTRTSPKFITGFAGGTLKGYQGLAAKTERTLHVERVDGTGATFTYDSTVTLAEAGPQDVASKTVFAAVAAVSLPIPIPKWRRWDGLSLTAGVDLGHPTDRQFYGISLLRFFGGRAVPVIEVLPLDIHLLALFARQAEVTDPNCAPGTCKTKDRTRYQSLSLMLSADAGSLVSDLVKKLIE
jgi:hypothetical protein